MEKSVKKKLSWIGSDEDEPSVIWLAEPYTGAGNQNGSTGLVIWTAAIIFGDWQFGKQNLSAVTSPLCDAKIHLKAPMTLRSHEPMNESTVWIWSQIDSCNELVICTCMYIYLVPASINYVFHQYLPSYMYAIGKWRFCLSIWLCRLGYDALRYISGRNISLKKKGRVADQTNSCICLYTF